MSQNEMVAKIEELNELEILMDGLKAQADAIRDDIKSEMAAQGTEELNLGKYIVRWTSVLSTRFDTKRFKEAFGEELYKAYTNEVSSRRFSIAKEKPLAQHADQSRAQETFSPNRKRKGQAHYSLSLLQNQEGAHYERTYKL